MTTMVSRRSVATLLGLSGLSAVGMASPPAHAAGVLPECDLSLHLEIFDEAGRSWWITVEGGVTQSSEQWKLWAWIGPEYTRSVEIPLDISGEVARFIAAIVAAEEVRS